MVMRMKMMVMEILMRMMVMVMDRVMMMMKMLDRVMLNAKKIVQRASITNEFPMSSNPTSNCASSRN